MDTISGLQEEEAARRLAAEGANELPAAKKRSLVAIALDVAREPMFLLLVAGGLLYLILGDTQEALMLMGFVAVVMGITLYQERKTERALEALRDLSSPRARVIRSGRERRIAGREVVRGDLMIVSEGDRVAADAVVLSSDNLSADESLLTGESVPVRKTEGKADDTMARPGGEDTPFIYSGTMIVQGRGLALVKSVGLGTEVGRIGKALQTVAAEDTQLQKSTRRLVRNLAMIGLSLCVLVVVIYGLTRGNWMQGLLAGITLAMATLPEEFPVVLTIFLALGAWRISQKRVLTRRMPAVETLGSATVLCVDKTGTLTENRMSVAALDAGGQTLDLRDNRLPEQALPERFHELVEYSILASQRDPFDPMEKAIHRMGENYLAHTEHIHRDWRLVRAHPLSPTLMALSHVWESPASDAWVIAAKGAPEAIADLCHAGQEQLRAIQERVMVMAGRGLRVLGVAKALFGKVRLPDSQHDYPFEWVGLIGLADPIRSAVPDAIRECRSAGIRVVMITGDYPATAQNIARQIGLESPEACLTGRELEQMLPAELQQKIPQVNIFARVAPEQKLQIVNALKAAGEIVAMTGDGVNDAPALKSAHIGVAMGGRGTDVARESASLVLLDDDFNSMVQAVRMGRRIFENIKKAIAYIFAIHVPIAGLSLVPVVLQWPLILLPVHVVFLELIIDPACSVVFEAEPEEADVMNRPPRDPATPLYGFRNVGLSVLQGASVLAVTLAVYGTALARGQGEMESRALAFTSLIIANLGLILTNLSWTQTIAQTVRRRNLALWWVLGGAALFLVMVLSVTVLRELFRFSPLHPADLALCLGAGAFTVLWFEAVKEIARRRKIAM